MNNLLEYRGLIDLFKKESLDHLRDELRDVKNRAAFGFNEIRQMLVVNCIKQAIREKELEGI
jgi:hypothetical protein